MWADFVAWFQSPGGMRVMQGIALPVLCLLVAAVVAALIGRAAVRAAGSRMDREQAATAVAGLVEAARAASAPSDSRSGSRRAGRLRTEADVRVRLLPLPGAALAADWAAARMDDLPQRDDGGPAVEEVRDALLAWVARPKRARRLFAGPTRRTADPAPAPRPDVEEERPTGDDATPVAESPSTRATAATTSDPQGRSGGAPGPVASRQVAAAGSAPETPAAPTTDGTVPAWRRTRAGERLQQERASWTGNEAASPTGEADHDHTVRTAPVRTQHPHRAEGLPVSDADDRVGAEAHQPARHAVGESLTADPEPAEPHPEPAPEPARRTPAWLDDYDDDAHVTKQDMDLRTPRPVSATSVRDRTPSGEDIVPRT